MKRLGFKIPEYAPRILWSSPLAREVWEPRIRRVSQAYMDVERLLVIEGVRPSALQSITPEELPQLMQDLAPKGLIALPLGKVPRADGYQSASQSLQAGAAWDYRLAVTSPANAAAWSEAWAAGDNQKIGALLGYPQCCRDFFDAKWVGEKLFDTTWAMAVGTVEAQHLSSGNTKGISVEPGINLLWRWSGVRTVSHLPCSFHCRPSIAQGEAALKAMATKYPEEAGWMAEILSWPVEWSALHGILEIRTPIHRVSAATDATANKLVVRYKGTGYPAEGAQGLSFPHRASVPKPPALLKPTTAPADNGFSSREAMTAAHAKILAAAPGPFDTVIDLGCGDGLLLSKIPAKRRVGVEINPAVAKKAEKRLDRVVVGDVTDHAFVAQILAEEQPSLVIAQNIRNPPASLAGYTVLSYSYDTNDAPRLLGPQHELQRAG